MKIIDIDNIKDFTTQLFMGSTFDRFLATEVTICTAATFSIDGHLNSDFVGEEEMQNPENAEGIVTWKKLRPICFEIIKGRKVPQRFKIVFKMPKEIVMYFLRGTGAAAEPDQIAGLFLNVNYQDGKLYCTTGAAMKTFSLDKSIETLWDEYMGGVLKKSLKG